MQDIINWVNSVFGPHVDWKQVVVLTMTPLFILGLIVEFFWLHRKTGRWDIAEPGQRFYWREVLASSSLGIGYYAAEAIMHLLLVGIALAWFWEHRFFTIPINAWTIVAAFFVEELCYYWYHRTAHRVRWFWTQHVSHHSGETMNMSTAARQSILNGVIGVWFFFVPPILLGFHPAIIFFFYGINLSYQWFIHTESIPRLHPWFEWMFDSASNHRVHHGRNAQYIDKNYGGVLMLYDHIFGTYEPEVEKVEYGTTRQIKSYNWFVLNFHEFVDMWRDFLAPGPLVQRLKHFWKPPEWERDGHQRIHTWTVVREGQPIAGNAPGAAADKLKQPA
ncbi:MAG: sterol desaturase family protein [Pedobacter sp.]|nr:sterol desaturase family protein [Pedobacter sp.]